MDNLHFFKTHHFLPVPKLLQIEITTQCPLRCPQCFIHEFPVRHMPIKIFKKHIKDASQMGVTTVVLFGGEPFCHPQICDLIDIACNSKIKVAIYTSGWSITEKTCDILSKYNDNIILFISLNGSRKEIHQKSRDGYELTLNAMRILHENAYPYIVNWVSREDNVYDLHNVYKLSHELGAVSINIVANKINSNYQVDSPLSLASYDIIKKEMEYNPDFYSIENCNMLLTNYILKDRPNHNLFSGCTAGISSCSITINSEYVPCLRLLYPEQHETLSDYWEQSITLKKLRDSHNKKVESYCNGCDYYHKCNYCRALSKETYFDFGIGLKDCQIKVCSESRKSE